MSAEHNHPPRCCCEIPNLIDGLVMAGHGGKWHQTDEDEAHPFEQCTSECGLCPSCLEHGIFATPYTEQETTNC
jgi:hypothetical protein